MTVKASATVFQTYEWFESWSQAIVQTGQLNIVTLWDGDSLVGIAQLMIRRRADLHQSAFIRTCRADYQDFILGAAGDRVVADVTAAEIAVDAYGRRLRQRATRRHLPRESKAD